MTYNVFRSTTSGFTPGTGNQIASGVSSTTYSDTGLTGSTTYYYLVEGTIPAGLGGIESGHRHHAMQRADGSERIGRDGNFEQPNQPELDGEFIFLLGITYNVFRSTTSGFTPGAAIRSPPA